MDEAKFSEYSTVSKEDQLKSYEMMQLCRQFENACNQAYMQGKIRGFMHLDNGQVHALPLIHVLFFLFQPGKQRQSSFRALSCFFCYCFLSSLMLCVR